MIEDLIIIIPSHNRQHYLGRVVKYYSSFPCKVHICDSSKNEIELECPGNIEYRWVPQSNFYGKVLDVINETSADFYALSPDDDFLNPDTLRDCYEMMIADHDYSLSVGKQVFFNKPYDGKFYCRKNANRMLGLNLGKDPVKNATLIGEHYQNVLWSLYRKDVIQKAFNKLVTINPENGNYVELTLIMEACVGGNVNISLSPLNYREYSEEEHWGKQVECISKSNLARNQRMESDMKSLFETYQDEGREIAAAFMDAYLKKENRWSVHHIVKAIQRRLFKNDDVIEVKPYNMVEQIILQ